MLNANMLCALLIVMSFPALAENAVTKDVEKAGATLVHLTTNGVDVRAEIHTHQVSIGGVNGSEQDTEPRNKLICTSTNYKCSLIDSVRLFVGDHEIVVPNSAFIDLADLNTASLTCTKRSFQLTLDGGDAAEAYLALLTFDKKRVFKREIKGGEGGGQPSEETKYYPPVVFN